MLERGIKDLGDITEMGSSLSIIMMLTDLTLDLLWVGRTTLGRTLMKESAVKAIWITGIGT